MPPMESSGGQMMPMAAGSAPDRGPLLLGMWISMMVAMMLPIGAPAVVHTLRADAPQPGSKAWGTLCFTGGYPAVWIGFTGAAAAAQSALDSRQLLSDTMALRSAAAMCLLFVGGIMNVLWMAVITLWMLAERTLPWGASLARATAVGLIVWGTVATAMAVR
jgi:predicted metal-binding membrane protein